MRNESPAGVCPFGAHGGRSGAGDAHAVDVTLLLEGTYPYVRGGVSGWVHEIVHGLPELRFALVYLGADRPDEMVLRYELPANVVSLQSFFLMEADDPPGKPGKPAGPGKPGKPGKSARPGQQDWFAASAELHRWFVEARNGEGGALPPDSVDTVVLQQGHRPGACAAQFFHGEAAWREIVRGYTQNCPHASLLDYFWAVRNTHAPLLRLGEILPRVPSSRLYHAITTGYAGLLGAMLKHARGRPLILTEHGIYTKERKMDLQAMFLRERDDLSAPATPSGMEHHEELWLRLFQGIGRLAYEAADPIVSLYERNRLRQVQDGADPARTRCIPNGVDVERFAHLRAQRAPAPPPVLGLIGRIVPIKDIKTFIRCIAAMAATMPQVQGWLIGPEDEDPEYARQCHQLVELLGQSGRIRFLGFRRIEEVLPQLGLLVLTSISEAFPLVIGEAWASGLPVLTTDVGACRELIEGRGAEDRALGAGGAVVPICDPQATARAAISLLGDTGRWHAAQRAGIARVERYYRQASMLESYRDLYAGFGAGSPLAAAGSPSGAPDACSAARAFVQAVP